MTLINQKDFLKEFIFDPKQVNPDLNPYFSNNCVQFMCESLEDLSKSITKKKGKLNYFITRSIDPDAFLKYKNPKISRDIIPFELFINWDSPITLCEGVFDAIAIKRNAIPLLGKILQPALLKKLVLSSVKKVYIALDDDAQEEALQHCEYLMSEGKEIYIVELNGKDPSKIGFEEFTKIIQKTKPLKFSTLLEKKLSLC